MRVLLATLGRSYAAIGNYQRAIQVLQRYAALHPDDGEAYGSLADFYKRTGKSAEQIEMLEQSIAVRPTPARAAELAILYRHAHEEEKELALLWRFSADLTVGDGLLMRLADLLERRGDRKGAIQVLMRPDVLSASPQPTHSAEARLLLAKLLIESKRSAEAVRLGEQWILEWREPWLASRLLSSVAGAAPVAEASDLADAVAVLHPEIRLFLAHGLAAAGAKPIARHLLETWASANPSPSMNDIAAFLSACRDQDEPAVVWQTLQEAVRRHAPNDVIGRYSVAIAAEFGIGALAPFWRSLPKTVIEQLPLLAAQLAFHEHDPGMTKRLLEKVDLAMLDASSQHLWIDLLTAVATPAEGFVVLRDRRHSGHLPQELLARYARLAAQLGQEFEYQSALGDLPGMRN